MIACCARVRHCHADTKGENVSEWVLWLGGLGFLGFINFLMIALCVAGKREDTVMGRGRELWLVEEQ